MELAIGSGGLVNAVRRPFAPAIDVACDDRIAIKVPCEHQRALKAALEFALPKARLSFWPDADPEARYAIVYDCADGIAELRQLRLIVAITAGVERLLGSGTLPAHVPVVRGVSARMTQHMTEYVVQQALDFHRQGRAYRELQSRSEWRPLPQPVACERSVGILGLGVLGTACARALAALGFNLCGWSRSAKDLPGIHCFTGREGLLQLLRRSQILVNMLPLTAETEGLLSHALLPLLPEGSFLISASRGAIVVEDALIEALDSGRLAGAALDVFEVEPLSPGHRLWNHPRVTVTPHCAGPSDLPEIAFVLADAIDRLARNLPLANQVDQGAGY